MKILILVLMIVTFYNASAQYGGVDRRIGRNPTPIGKKAKEKVDYMEVGINKLAEDLELDAFQKAVVTDLMESNVEESRKVQMMDISNDLKIEKIVGLREKLNADIIKILNPVQIEKYEALREKQSKKKKKK
ncbi:MAG: hypothetical protein IR153_09200 [Flavobacterium sp.]|nr:hypothetical protein [Flavobacterium sp.]